MTQRLGEVSGEGGPFLIFDRDDAKAWPGSLDEAQYSLVTSVPFMTGAFVFEGRTAVTWEAEGAGTIVVHRLTPNGLLLQREWADEAPTPDLPPTAEEFASIQIASGTITIMWAPVAWEDLWEPLAADSEGQLSMPTMLNVGLQIRLPRGVYSLAAERTVEAYRCWVTGH